MSDVLRETTPAQWQVMSNHLLRIPPLVMPHRAVYTNAKPVQAGSAVTAAAGRITAGCLAGTKSSTK